MGFVEITTQALRRIALFAGLTDETLVGLASVARLRACAPGETIAFEGDPCQAACFIMAGQVRISRLSPGGRELVLARLGPGQAFDVAPPFQPRGVTQATARAVTPVVLCAIPADDFRSLASARSDLALAVLHDLADRLDHLTAMVEDMALRSVRGRLARFLLDHAEKGGVAQRWTQEEIAAHVGTVRDVVGRTLRAFAEAGLVRLDRQRILLLDRQGLEAEGE